MLLRQPLLGLRQPISIEPQARSQRNVAWVGISHLGWQAIFCSFGPSPLLGALAVLGLSKFSAICPSALTLYVNSSPAKKRNGPVWTHLYRWNHEFKVQTHIKQICDTKSICFNPFTWRYNTSWRGGGMVAPNCLHGRCDSAHLGDGRCIYHFTPLAQRTVRDLLLILTIFALTNLNPDT